MILWDYSTVLNPRPSNNTNDKFFFGLSWAGFVDLALTAKTHKLLTVNTAKYYEPTYLKIYRVKKEIKIDGSLCTFTVALYFIVRLPLRLKRKILLDQNFKLGRHLSFQENNGAGSLAANI